MERVSNWENRFGKGAVIGIGGGLIAEIAGLPVIFWQTLLNIGVLSGAGWVGMKFFNRGRSPQVSQ